MSKNVEKINIFGCEDCGTQSTSEGTCYMCEGTLRFLFTENKDYDPEIPGWRD